MGPSAANYQQRLVAVLDEAFRLESGSVQKAAAQVAETFAAGRILYIFGSGHSHVMGEEAFYRAGGAVRVCPVLKPPYMLHEGAVHSTVLERESGHAPDVLSGYTFQPGDTMLVVSNSGANALPIEVAAHCVAAGIPVIAITSRQYASSIERPGRRLHDVADIVIDNHCPPGDALVELGAGLPNVGPASTVVGAALLNSMLVQAMAIQLERGETPEVFMSANLPGAAAHNAAAVTAMTGVVPHL